MKHTISLVLFFLFFAVFYIAGCRNAGEWLVKNDDVKHADAMVILMGSVADRILQAIDLYNDGLAEHVIIAEVEVSAYEKLDKRGFHLSSNTELVYDAAIALGFPENDITILPGKATSTRMEALMVSHYLSSNSGIDTIIIISSAPHTRRASIIFNQTFKKFELPVTVICCPSKYTNFNSRKWWRTENGIRVVLSEYVKLVNFLLGSESLDKEMSEKGTNSGL